MDPSDPAEPPKPVSLEPIPEQNLDHSLLRRELDNRPSGLSLLVAAVDAQDPDIFRNSRPESVHSMEGCSSASSQGDSTLQIDLDNPQRAVSESGSINGDSCSSKNGSGGRRRSIPETEKDEHYWEKRRRNNEAAKRSREKRKMNDIAMESRLLELSKENSILKTELIHTVPPTPPIPAPLAAHGPIAQPRPPHPSIQTSSNSPFLPVKPEPRQNTAAPLSYVPPIRAPSQAAAPESMLPNPPIPTNPLTGLHAAAAQLQAAGQNSTAAQQPHSALAAALNANPATALPQSLLTAMLPPSALLQHLTAAYSQAQMAALLTAQQQQLQQRHAGVNGHPTITAPSHSLPLYMGGNQVNGQNGQLKQVSPDSTVEKLLTRVATAPSANAFSAGKSDINGNSNGILQSTPNPSMDGKQYLRYKLLEKQQNKVLTATPQATSGQNTASPGVPVPSNAILGSLLTSGRLPAQLEADSSVRDTVINGHGRAATAEPGNMSVKQCLSSLAVHLASEPSTGSRNSDSSLTGSDGSQISPASSHEAESNTSSVSQPSPPHTILSALGMGNGESNSREGSLNGDPRMPKRHLSESERYMERRRRNNEAAKRCRANRRALFEYRFKRAQELEQENVHLKEEMQRLSRELMELKELLTKKNGRNGLMKFEPTSENHRPTMDILANGNSAVSNVPTDQNGTMDHEEGVPTSPSRDSGQDLSSESGNDENHHVTIDERPPEGVTNGVSRGRSLEVAEDLTIAGKMDEN